MTDSFPKKHGFPAGSVIAQTSLVAVLMLAALLAPPSSGSILLVPLLPVHGGSLLQPALAQGARLEGAGPFAGSFVVRAERSRIAGPMLRAGVLMLAARPLLCGGAKGGAP